MMVAATASLFLISSFPLEAASFGKSSSSGSRGSSFSSGSSSRSTSTSSFSSGSSNRNTSSSSGGVSQGGSIGMSRANVANNVKSGNYSAPQNGTTVAGSNPSGNNSSTYSNSNRNYANNNSGYNGSYNNGYNGAYQQAPQGHSTGTVVGAAAAGALAGYALGNHNSNGTTVVVPNGNNGAVYSNNGYAGGNPVVVDNNGNYSTSPMNNGSLQSSSSSFGNLIWSLIKIILGLVILFFIVRFLIMLFNRNRNEPVFGSANGTSAFSNKTPEDEIRDMKEDFFVQFQTNNRPSGLDYIRQNSTPVFYNAIEEMVNEQSDTRSVKVRQIEAELVDLTQEGSRYIASVRYHAVISEGVSGQMQDSDVKELWNFVYENNRWKLAGIDQL